MENRHRRIFFVRNNKVTFLLYHGIMCQYQLMMELVICVVFFFVFFVKINEYIFEPYHFKHESSKDSQSSTNRLKPWEEFCRTTKMHGFNFMVDHSKPKWFRMIATSAVLTGFLLFIGLGLSASTIFFNPSITTSLTTATPDFQPFPSIHICDKTYFSRKRLKGKLLLL